jgi:phosphopantothenoylcysteine decarboxylase / phosphopantothenate---cysteine ligase
MDNIDKNDNDFDNTDIFSHPSKDIKATLGTELIDKKIVICVTASVACYKTIDLVRLLMRHGAEIFIVMSKTVEKFISKDYFVWASGNKVVSALSGNLEHIVLADYGKSDLVIVYPATANTIGKFANGVDDTPPTSVLSVALGSKIPIIIAPAMHQSMYENNIIKKNIFTLEKENVVFVNPVVEEGKAKIVDIDIVLTAAMDALKKDNILRINSTLKNPIVNISYQNIDFIKKDDSIIYDIDEDELKSFFKGKRILISLGSTIEYIDPIRVITNTSSGKMGISLVKNALDFGFNVTVIKGLTNFNTIDDKVYSKSNLKILDVKTTQQMYDVVVKELKSFSYDIVILAAAVSDFKPFVSSNFKISSENKSLALDLVPTVKIVDRIKNISKDSFLVAFKADCNISADSLLQKSYKKLIDSNADLVVANDICKKDTHIGSELNEIFLINKNKNYFYFPIQNKYDISNKIFKIIYLDMKNILQKPSP